MIEYLEAEAEMIAMIEAEHFVVVILLDHIGDEATCFPATDSAETLLASASVNESVLMTSLEIVVVAVEAAEENLQLSMALDQEVRHCCCSWCSYSQQHFHRCRGGC